MYIEYEVYEVINFLFCRYASLVNDGSEYFILLIISDGVISDMAQTKESIVNVSSKTQFLETLHHSEKTIEKTSVAYF